MVLISFPPLKHRFFSFITPILVISLAPELVPKRKASVPKRFASIGPQPKPEVKAIAAPPVEDEEKLVTRQAMRMRMAKTMSPELCLSASPRSLTPTPSPASRPSFLFAERKFYAHFGGFLA